MSNTGTFSGKYKGTPVISIQDIDENGEPVTRGYPIITFGLRKAKAILEHIEEIEIFVKENDGK